MAGTWIIMKHDLQTSPEVRRITRRTSASSTHETIGRLHAVWSWADIHSEDGRIVADPEDVDGIAGCDGFAAAMVDAGWLVVGSAAGSATICFPNFGDHNGKTAKRRLKESARKGSRRAMSAKCPQNVRNNADKMRNTEQNRTEQDKENAARSCRNGETPPRPTTTQRAENRSAPVVWKAETGFAVCSFRRAQWAKAYPLVDIQRELDKAHAWYLDNPKSRKRQHARFLGRWLSRAQDNAEQDEKAGKRPGVHLNDVYNIIPDDPNDHPINKLKAARRPE